MADISETLSVSCKPFLRWAGGKSWLLKEISYFLPKEFNNYHEPFIGGGSVYLYLKNQGKIKNYSFLSDVNEDLINAYNIVKNSPSELSDILETYVNEKEFYYLIRSQKPTDKILRAAQFIYLNRTSFNGIYRVNLKGEYNVPYGYKSYKRK
jgi:DNA adenine methylase